MTSKFVHPNKAALKNEWDEHLRRLMRSWCISYLLLCTTAVTMTWEGMHLAASLPPSVKPLVCSPETSSASAFMIRSPLDTWRSALRLGQLQQLGLFLSGLRSPILCGSGPWEKSCCGGYKRNTIPWGHSFFLSFPFSFSLILFQSSDCTGTGKYYFETYQRQDTFTVRASSAWRVFPVSYPHWECSNSTKDFFKCAPCGGSKHLKPDSYSPLLLFPPLPFSPTFQEDGWLFSVDT